MAPFLARYLALSANHGLRIWPLGVIAESVQNRTLSHECPLTTDLGCRCQLPLDRPSRMRYLTL